MNKGEMAWRQAFVAFVAAAGLLGGAHAIDNPDAPDRVGAFERRAAPLEQGLEASDGGGAAAQAGRAYDAFLDSELNIAYRELLSKLDDPARQALVEAQRRWLLFRDAEYGFMGRHWTRERSGSSASLSIAGYRSALVKTRIVQLLRYGAEYP
ncbi:DUF1311 domain-containing protein [Roseateles sp. DAIF2]|uniref:lysozyme inhibitor LprI family protein n=1 Tax=Roseateles sp. DAIF2 TaxID=2714952 RepID=UPI0018A2D462|nr:lysozyme inhibitor LprI family protein [Roseateles sp. DAIF2]QPF71976.1 DUF1311 domain-containing protein [Roseateles sp. DAIF2]